MNHNQLSGDAITQLDGQELALTQAVCASFNWHALYVCHVSLFAVYSKYLTVSVTKNTKIFNTGSYIISVVIM